MNSKDTTAQEHVQESKSSDEDLPQEKRPSGTADVFVGDHGADTELRRILSTRHLTMIALGSSIGMGLWLGSGPSCKLFIRFLAIELCDNLTLFSDPWRPSFTVSRLRVSEIHDLVCRTFDRGDGSHVSLAICLCSMDREIR